jgi:glycosyltransferase involved in cell wall biosynthesis
MSPARILILTNGPLARNPRVVKEASALGAAGHDVTVLTVRNHVPSEILDDALLAGAPFRRVTVDLLPGHDAGRVAVFGRRLFLWANRKLAKFTSLANIHSLGPALSLRRAAWGIPTDLTIVHNEIAHWVGTKLLAAGRRVAADIEDWHSEDLLPEARHQRPLGALRQMERTLLHHAVYTTTTSNALADALHARYGGSRPEVITNSFPLPPPPTLDRVGQPPAFFWFSQTLGPGRGLEPFVAAWTLMRKPSRLVLLGESAAVFQRELLAQISPAKQSLVEFLALVPAAELPSVIARYDIGLALELSKIPNRDLTITNKILQYLGCGLAVVASDTQGQQEVLSKLPAAGIIVTLDNPTTMAGQLDALLTDQAALLRRRQAARQLAASNYCWEREAPHLLSLVDRAFLR